MQKQNTALSLPYCPMISKLSKVRCVANTRGEPRCNFSTIRKVMVGRGGWGRNKGKCPPKKFMQMTGRRVRPCFDTYSRRKNFVSSSASAHGHEFTSTQAINNRQTESGAGKLKCLLLTSRIHACILAINYAPIFEHNISNPKQRRLSSMPKKPQPLICEAILVSLIIFA